MTALERVAIQRVRAKLSMCQQSVKSAVPVVDNGGSEERQQGIREVRYHLEKAQSVLNETWPPNEQAKSEGMKGANRESPSQEKRDARRIMGR